MASLIPSGEAGLNRTWAKEKEERKGRNRRRNCYSCLHLASSCRDQLDSACWLTPKVLAFASFRNHMTQFLNTHIQACSLSLDNADNCRPQIQGKTAPHYVEGSVCRLKEDYGNNMGVISIITPRVNGTLAAALAQS